MRKKNDIGCLLALLLASPAYAQVTRVEITSREPAGSYEVIRGRITGEVDPKDRRNVIIQDIALAPKNARGRVEYVATFALARPADLTRTSGVLLYSVVNRGNGGGDAQPDGHISLISGWQGDVTPTANNQTISVPVARQADGSPITGLVLARFMNVAPGTNTVGIRLSSMGGSPPVYLPATTDQPNAVLTSSASENARGAKTGTVTIPRGDWAFADCRTQPFPGTPDPTRLCLKSGFDPSRLYELTYTAKDPLVLGIGLAATRDIVAFFGTQRQTSAAPRIRSPARSNTRWRWATHSPATSSRRSFISASTRTCRVDRSGMACFPASRRARRR
jgi:hypothetical protein